MFLLKNQHLLHLKVLLLMDLNSIRRQVLLQSSIGNEKSKVIAHHSMLFFPLAGHLTWKMREKLISEYSVRRSLRLLLLALQLKVWPHRLTLLVLLLA